MRQSNYYPFGLKHKGYNGVTSSNGNSIAQKKLYSGKEFQDELGLNWHDYGARNYDASLGRWFSIDNKAELYVGHSTYHYSANNPIYFKDVDGNYYVGTDGKRVTTSIAKDGSIKLSSNASTDLKRMANLINASGSKTAISQFNKVGNNETRVNFQIIDEVNNEKDFGDGVWGLHQAHDRDGNALAWLGDGKTGKFSGRPKYKKDSDGNTIYDEATITLFAGNIQESLDKAVEKGKIKKSQVSFYKLMLIVAVVGHEGEHNLNLADIQAIITRLDNDDSNDNNRDVEGEADKIFDQIRQEIIDKFTKKED